MWPTLYTQHTNFADVPFNSWGLMITVAFSMAVLVSHRRAARVGIDPDKLVGFYALSIVLGLVGARLMHFLMATPKEFFAHPEWFFQLSHGGFAFYGGFILAGIGGVMYGRSRGIDGWKLSDVVAPTVMLGLAFGRIGCFLAGCCHGKAFDLPAAATPLLPTTFKGGQIWLIHGFPYLAEMTHRGVGHNDIVVYPTQIWEMLACFAIFGITSVIWHRFRKFDGIVIAAVLLLYAVWRPINESMRGDTIRGTDWYGLTSSQFVSVLVAPVGILVFLIGMLRGRKPETPFVPQSDDDLIEGSAPKL